MKLLVIGIDGGSRDIIDAMPMPFSQGLFAQSANRDLDEDLISRGWAEVLTGEHASENKAFYLMPVAEGGLDFNASYSKSDMLSCSRNEPLWKRLNQAGTSVGLMNIPTTGPADPVDGFLVAGGGGGLKADGAIPPTMMHPQSCKPLLEKHNYVFDVRLPGGETTVSGFLEKIRQAENAQKDTFIELARKEKPDFGFHCFRITTEVQYLARFEIERVAEAIREACDRGEVFQPETPTQQKVVEHYSNLDSSIKELFDTLEPEHYIFVGDHSTALLRHEGNVDVWLERAGYLTRMSPAERKARGGLIRLRNKADRLAVKYLGKKSPPLIRRPLTKFSPGRTRAFGTFYDTGNFAGIFINDRARFGGPVSSEQQHEKLVDEICQNLNATGEAQKYQLDARPYRRNYPGARFQRLMPDIRIHKPDSIYFSGRHWVLIRDNQHLKPLDENLAGIRYPHTGAKGHDPVFVFSPALGKHLREDDPNDLRVVYSMICRHFEGVA
mgnify:CR=1 FL=1